MAIMTAEQLLKEIAEIDRYVSEMPGGHIPIEHQLAIVSHTLGRTLGTLKDTMETLAAHLAVTNGDRNNG